MTAQEQALAEILAEGVRSFGVENVFAKDDSAERKLPCVSVTASRGDNDPMGSDCYEYKVQITARTKNEADMAIVGGKIAELQRSNIGTMVNANGEFRCYGVRFDGAETSPGPNSRTTAMSFALWCVDKRS